MTPNISVRNFRYLRAASFSLAFGILGTVVILHSFAASPFAQALASTATTIGGASVVTNPSAVTGKMLLFGPSAAPPPTPAPAPTPTPTPTPVPSPAPITNPPAGAVTYGWQLTSTNTGLAGAGINASTLPTFQGSISAGMTISRMKITTSLDLSNIPNVTLDHVLLIPSAGGNIRALILGPGTTIVDSDIDGSMMDHSGEQIGIYGCVPAGKTYSINRVNLTGMTVGAWLDCDGNGSMVDTYIHGLVSNNGAHMDGFTRRAGIGQLTVARTRIDDSGASVTGALFFQSTWGGPIAGVLVTNSYLEGDGYVIGMSSGSAPGDITSAGFQNVRVRSTGWGPISTDHRVIYTSWTDVRQYDASRLPLADGAAIASQ